MLRHLAPVAIVIPLAACSTTPTPTTAVGTVQDVFIGVIDIAEGLHASKRITDKQYVEVVNPLVQDGRVLVNEWHAAVKENRPFDAATLHSSILAVIAQLRTINAEAAAK